MPNCFARCRSDLPNAELLLIDELKAGALLYISFGGAALPNVGLSPPPPQ